MATAKKLPSGSWRVQILARYDAGGKKIQKSFTAPTKWEAEKMADEYKRYKKEKPTDKQVGKIIDEYIEIKSNVLSPTTIRGYKAIRATRLQPIMGGKLSRLTATDIQRAVNDDSAVYSAKSLRDAYFLLVAAVKRVSPETAACWNITLPAKKPVISSPTTGTKKRNRSECTVTLFVAVHFYFRHLYICSIFYYYKFILI